MALLALTAALPVKAMPVMPTDAPIERLLTNVTTYVKAHPADPDGYYTLGRVHYFAFAAPKRGTVPILRQGSGQEQNLPVFIQFGPPGKVSEYGREPKQGAPAVPALSAAARREHVQAAVTNLRKAIQLEMSGTKPKGYGREGLSELTLACVFEEGKEDAAKDWQEQAITYYGRAWARASVQDLKQTRQPIFGIDTLVSDESGKSYLRLIQARGGAKPAENAQVAEVTEGLKKLAALPRSNIVTPIVLSLDGPRSLGELVPVSKRKGGMRFDLDGSGRATQVYSAWPAPSTALLVWDPSGSGQITSGRQLFGGATWWMFWNSGYDALASLDDDGDGWLSGKELKGLALWFDRNGNGVSDPGEVVPVAGTSIAALATRADGADGDGSPRNSSGLRLKDGRTLPTYDWTITSRRR